MMDEIHEQGFVKRVDRRDGWSDLVDWSGRAVATVRTEMLANVCENGKVRRLRAVIHRDVPA